MGITRTEGVFRRCCEFTLEVLRNEAYNITTILDVLRYDPLYSWSMSPVRIKRMQDNPYEASEVTKTSVDGVPKKNKDDDADADRALTVVAKKLSKTLSVGATVNELIQQAGDENNLATLYAGTLWMISEVMDAVLIGVRLGCVGVGERWRWMLGFIYRGLFGILGVFGSWGISFVFMKPNRTKVRTGSSWVSLPCDGCEVLCIKYMGHDGTKIG